MFRLQKKNGFTVESLENKKAEDIIVLTYVHNHY